MCTVLLPPGDNPIAVNKYINININTNGLPDDEYMMFETSRRHQEVS